ATILTLFPYTTLFRSPRKHEVGFEQRPFDVRLDVDTRDRESQHLRRLHGRVVIRHRVPVAAFARNAYRTRVEVFGPPGRVTEARSEEHTSELQSRENL